MTVVLRLTRDTLVYGGGDFVAKLIAFLSFPVIAAALSPRAFGALELVLTTTALLGLLVNFGLNNAVQRYYWDRETTRTDQQVLVTTGMCLQLAFGAIATAGALAVLPLMRSAAEAAELPLGTLALAAAAVLLPAQQWLQYILDVTRLHFAPIRFLAVALLSRAAGAAASVGAVLAWRAEVDAILVALAAVSVAVMPIALWTIRQDLIKRFELGRARELIHFGYPFIFAGLAYWLFTSMDRWMLAAMSSVEETGIYSVAARFASVVMFVSTAFGQAWSPYAIKLRADHPQEYRRIYASVLLVLLFVMLVVGGGLAMFSGEIIRWMMPSEYNSSAVPLAIMCLGATFQATQQVTAIGISLERKTFLFARLAWLAALVNFVTNLALIPSFGAAGAAWATTIAYLVLTGGYIYFTQRLHPLPFRWKTLAWLVFLASLLPIAGACASLSSFDASNWGVKVAVVALGVGLAIPALPLRELRGV